MDIGGRHELDRKTAGRLLGVTTRTIDRYIENGKLKAKKIRGEIRLYEDDVLKLKDGEPVKPAKKYETRGHFELTRHSDDANFYKDLYEETLRVLDEKEKKLEQANYRIGQLESQITSRFPVKIFETENTSQMLEILRQSLESSEKSFEGLKKQLEKERLNRKIITTILYALLLLQPILWYFLQAS